MILCLLIYISVYLANEVLIPLVPDYLFKYVCIANFFRKLKLVFPTIEKDRHTHSIIKIVCSLEKRTNMLTICYKRFRCPKLRVLFSNAILLEMGFREMM